MKFARVIFACFSFLMLFPAVCRAGSQCPWMNGATAFGILEAESSTVEGTPEVSATTCTFTYHAERGVRQLRITVEPQKDPVQAFQRYKAQCSPGSNDLRALGNEAVMCFTDRKKKSHGEQVIGRVRENIFIVSVRTSDKRDLSMSGTALEEKTQRAAEQIAGNLF